MKIVILSVLIVLFTDVSGQRSNSPSIVADTLYLLNSNIRSLRSIEDSTSYRISSDGQAIYAIRNGELLWEVWPFEQYPLPMKDDPNYKGSLEIRMMILEKEKLSIVVGKHCHYEIFKKGGYLRFLGCD